MMALVVKQRHSDSDNEANLSNLQPTAPIPYLILAITRQDDSANHDHAAFGTGRRQGD